MWEMIPLEDKEEYKKLILAFSSLTEMFTQKSLDDTEIPSPIINSKYQETVFQKALHANAEDIGNTSYDASLKIMHDGKEEKFLIGIKTFGIQSGDQKIAQFKSYHQHYLIDQFQQIEKSFIDNKGKTKSLLDKINFYNYLSIAKELSQIRNERIESSIQNLKGFKVEENDEIHSVYHVLMPSKKGDNPKIYVGETDYDKIDIDNIKVLGCTSVKNPSNFVFTDGKHTYKYTSADSQLYMKFNNSHIIVDEWDVVYAKDAYSIFSEIGDKVYSSKDTTSHKPKVKISESYSWSILNKSGNIEKFSGFNSFYGVGSKLSSDSRKKRCDNLYKKYITIVDKIILDKIYSELKSFLLKTATNNIEREIKVLQRDELMRSVKKTQNSELESDIVKLVYRPMNEMYIPIPNSKKFHKEHPNFFTGSIGKMVRNEETGVESFELSDDKENRKFNLVFEPSGDSIESFIAQDGGKAIESCEKQSYLGEWILRKVFQLEEYEPLSRFQLEQLGINGIRLYKLEGSNDIHIHFIWIDMEDLPDDYFE